MPSNDLKMCQSCRALIPANATRCEMCGAEGHYAARARVTGESFGLLANWPVTTLLLTLNVLVYALALLYQLRLFAQLDDAPGFSMSPYPIVNDGFGTSYPGLRQNGEWWRLLASCFLHGGPIHLLFNSLALMQAGRIAEEVFGRAQYICLYILGGVGGNLLAIMFGSRVVGASGALFGLIAALAVYGYKRRDTLGRSLRQDMIYWLLYGLAISFLPGISMAAHAGGAVVGAALASVLPDEEQLRQSFLRMRLAQVFGTLAWLLILGTGVLMARNVLRQDEMIRVATAAERVYTVWLNHLQLDKLLAGARLKQSGSAAASELPDLHTLAKRVDQTQRALCSDIGALERLPSSDEESGQLYQRMANTLRARCDKTPPLPKEDNEAALQQALSGFQSQAERGKELDELMKQYEQWLARKADSLRVPVKALKPRFSGAPDESESNK